MRRCVQLLFCAACLLMAVSATARPIFAVRVTFKDKQGAPPLSAASTWLSERSLARRAQFGIPLDQTDQPVSQPYMDTVLQVSSGQRYRVSRWLNSCVILVNDTASFPLLRSRSWIRSVQFLGAYLAPNAGVAAPPPHKKAEPLMQNLPATYAKTTGSATYYGNTWAQTTMVHGDTLHDQGFRGKGKLVAVIDDGFSGTDTHRGFDSLRKDGRLLETYNFVYDTSYVFAYGSHGTNCLSNIAGLWPGRYVGAAPDAQYALYITEDNRVTDALYELDNLVAGIEKADSLGADIVSASIGYNEFVNPSYTFPKSDLDGKTTIVAKAVNLATTKGMLYVASAGNEGGNAWNFLTTPADADSCLAIGAVAPNRTAESYSSPGPNAAGRVKPDVVLQGTNVAVFSPGSAISFSAGTSFATPQAAGWAACLMQEFPGATPYLIRETFARISDEYTSPTPKLGFGIPDFRKAQQYLTQYFPDTGKGSFEVLPNPFTSYLLIMAAASASLENVTLHDVAGRSIGFQLLRQPHNAVLTPSAPLSKGIYILSFTAEGQRYTRKLLQL